MSAWREELALLEAIGGTLTRGLSERELRDAESAYSLRFPSDLRELLALALPIGERFPDWRELDSSAIRASLAWPAEGITFDVEHDRFWWTAWGAKPSSLAAALDVARAELARVPKLVPVYGHRYMPSEPLEAGNPVFSAYQSDVIYYGSDLRSYLRREARHLAHAEAIAGPRRPIRFWTDLVDSWGGEADP